MKETTNQNKQRKASKQIKSKTNKRCGEIFCLDESSAAFTITCTACDFKEQSFDSFVQHFKNVHQVSDIQETPEQDPINLDLLQENASFFKFPENLKETLVDINTPESDTPDDFAGIKDEESKYDTLCETQLDMNSDKEECQIENEKPKKYAKTTHKCSKCDGIYTSGVALRRHMKRDHPVEKNSKCSKCKAAFEDEVQLETHIKDKHSRVPCDVCGRDFADKATLREHLVIHSDAKDFPCDFEGCQLAFKSRHRLLIHRRRHDEEPKYVCEICGYRTKNRGCLVVHVRSHTKEKPFKCKVCGKAFMSSSMVIEHMPVHSTDRPHRCNKCDATFSTTKSLYHHKHLHLGIKKFVCKICGSAYAQAAGLSAHKRSHRANLPVQKL